VKNQSHFYTVCHEHLNKEVEVVTTEGTYTGTLVHVESDAIILQTMMRGRTVRMAIRIAFIVTIFEVVPEPRGPFWFGFPPNPNEQHHESSDHVKTHESR
jgi:small nuclear ribonucleoprotein (snRNP)-like protein